jgi:hypothetical protein
LVPDINGSLLGALITHTSRLRRPRGRFFFFGIFLDADAAQLVPAPHGFQGVSQSPVRAVVGGLQN